MLRAGRADPGVVSPADLVPQPRPDRAGVVPELARRAGAGEGVVAVAVAQAVRVVGLRLAAAVGAVRQTPGEFARYRWARASTTFRC